MSLRDSRGGSLATFGLIARSGAEQSRRVARVAAPPIAESQVDQVARLLAAIRAEHLPDKLIALADATPGDLAALDADGLRAYLRMLRDSDLRRRGQRPPDEDARALCVSCGPVWIAPEIASVAPLLDGWPRVLGCPWCHVENRLLVPRPPHTCSGCRRFERDPINPAGGMGRCTGGHHLATYPHAQRICQEYTP